MLEGLIEKVKNKKKKSRSSSSSSGSDSSSEIVIDENTLKDAEKNLSP
jgi:hypothetical protein